MQVTLSQIPMREILHFLGWHGTPVEPTLMEQIKRIRKEALDQIRPRAVVRRFARLPDGTLDGTRFLPQGGDVRGMLASCHEAVLLAATLGTESERMLLREQTKSATDALILDAALSAAIEAVCDQMEEALRDELTAQGLYLTDRFSPGYGDMPLAQSGQICEVLNVGRTIGLTVSQSGILIPRKSVTAIMGVSRTAVSHRPKGCEGCSARQNCAFARHESITEEQP